jgi:hypothetical protein
LPGTPARFDLPGPRHLPKWNECTCQQNSSCSYCIVGANERATIWGRDDANFTTSFPPRSAASRTPASTPAGKILDE